LSRSKNIRLIAYDGSDAWMEGVLVRIKECLESKEISASAKNCKSRTYTMHRAEVEV